jgi:hypothetical protein
MSPPPDAHGGKDPFAPPDAEGHDDSTFALAPHSRAHATRLSEDVRPVVPEARRPVAYKAPSGGLGNFILWAFAGLGFLGAVGGGIRYAMNRSAAPEAAAASGPGAPAGPAGAGGPGAAASAPAKPVAWKAVETGDAVLVRVDAPRGARLLLDGQPLPSNPVRLTRGTVHTITAVTDGGAQAAVEVTADKAKTVKLRPGRKRP